MASSSSGGGSIVYCLPAKSGSFQLKNRQQQRKSNEIRQCAGHLGIHSVYKTMFLNELCSIKDAATAVSTAASDCHAVHGATDE